MTTVEAAAFDPEVLARLSSLEWKARYVMEGFLLGIHGSPFHGASLEFRDYRDYEPGDDLRHLDWRLFARCDRLYVKRFEQETNARAYLLCDASASMSYRGSSAWGSKFECARVVALALSWLLLRQKDAPGLIALAPGASKHGPERGDALRYLRPSQRPDQAGLLLRELRSLSPLGGPALYGLLGETSRLAHRRSLIFLLTDLLEPAEELARAFERLRFEGHECVVLQILDRDEVEFPFSGSLVFEDLESGERRQAAADEVRIRYRRRFDAFMESYGGLFRRLEMTHGVLRTDQDPGKALARTISPQAAPR